MRLSQLIYVSRPFGFHEGTLDDILVSACRHNERNGITGSLVCRADLFLQILEGPRAAVTETFGRILRDDRHVEATILHCGDTPERMFASWTMRDDPPQSWMWPREEVREGVLQSTTAAHALTIFRRLSRLPRAA
ncbi:BLUF domain-containing protein [Roseomonas sp. PWR1]|uniref:BLUF domain-containing protein n=1 Tax=Roseomonas nitratireducens TaxID=2820810 RepID=A0ABS4AZC1_9PROT|nr:BLUF domain-containing protein [Neoroseomonas nitratireducens]MBP0466699.1 BLUF domain-containing protein [Neoroseomonas nitratireducens]